MLSVYFPEITRQLDDDLLTRWLHYLPTWDHQNIVQSTRSKIGIQTYIFRRIGSIFHATYITCVIFEVDMAIK